MNPTADISANSTFSAANSNRPSDAPSLTFTRNQRWLLLILCVGTYLATKLVFIHVLPLLHTPGFGGSLLLDANPIISLTSTFVWCGVVFATAGLIGRSIRPDVGLFAVAIALFAIRNTGGLTREVYFAHPTAAAVRMLALELSFYGVCFGLLLLATRELVRRGILRDDAALDGIRTKPEPLGQSFLATFAHFMVVCVIILTVIHSDQRMQVAAMLTLASLLASIFAVRFIPATPSAFFWLGPIVAGVVAYLVTSVSDVRNLTIGEPAGYCAGLARALPLDFASAGVAGAIYGYWIGRGWIPEDALGK